MFAKLFFAIFMDYEKRFVFSPEITGKNNPLDNLTYYRPHSIQLIEDAVQQPGFANTGFHIVENIQY